VDQAESHRDGGVNQVGEPARQRVWSWAASQREVAERVRHAGRLVGQRLTVVRYVDIDYRRDRVAPGWEGLRHIVEAAEWRNPTWRYPGFDSVDFGLELETESGSVFSVTWDPPGMHEGIGLREQPLLGTGVRADAAVAVWDVTGRSGWAALHRAEILDVRPHYQPSDAHEGSYWCPRITIAFPLATVDLLLGDAGPTQQLVPSADNIAITFDPHPPTSPASTG
jgi:hypothetical protein